MKLKNISYFLNFQRENLSRPQEKTNIFFLDGIFISNKKSPFTEQLIHQKIYFLLGLIFFRFLYSTFTRRSDFRKNAAYDGSKQICVFEYYTKCCTFLRLVLFYYFFLLMHNQCKYMGYVTFNYDSVELKIIHTKHMKQITCICKKYCLGHQDKVIIHKVTITTTRIVFKPGSATRRIDRFFMHNLHLLKNKSEMIHLQIKPADAFFGRVNITLSKTFKYFVCCLVFKKGIFVKNEFF